MKFPNYLIEDNKSQIDYKIINIHPSSKYSSLLPYQIPELKSVFEHELKIIPNSILDANGNIGMDSIFFRMLYPKSKITTVEIVPEICYILESNNKNLIEGNVLNRGIEKKLDIICDDVLNILQTGIKADFVYFDPPWGGNAYDSKNSLYLSNIIIDEIIIHTLINNTNIVILKLPNKYNLSSLNNILKLNFNKYSLKIYHIYKPETKKTYRSNIAYDVVFIYV